MSATLDIICAADLLSLRAALAALTILFGVWPILLSIQVSFTASATALRPDPTYVGFANYLSVFSDPLFWRPCRGRCSIRRYPWSRTSPSRSPSRYC